MAASQPYPTRPAPLPPGPQRALLPPAQADWDAMTPPQRQAVMDALLAEQETFDRATSPPESDGHYDAKEETRRTLRDFFGRTGQGVYVGAERAVFYPGEPGFTPDILVVAGVSPHKRDSWMVTAEGRGPDVVIEVHYKGDWKKDFVDNVARYARLGIAEYFIYDVGRQSLTAYRLPEQGGPYQPLRVRGGRVRSERLGMELGIRRGRLRFYLQGAVLPTTDEVVAELTEVAEQEQARAEQEQARAEQEQARAERSLAGLRSMLLALLAHQGRSLTEDQQARIHDCQDPLLLQRWFERALSASATDLFLDS